MYCSNCGKEIAEESNFCKFCGYKMAIAGDFNKNESPTIPTEIEEITPEEITRLEEEVVDIKAPYQPTTFFKACYVSGWLGVIRR